jgi:hypothetical protein
VPKGRLSVVIELVWPQCGQLIVKTENELTAVTFGFVAAA